MKTRAWNDFLASLINLKHAESVLRYLSITLNLIT